MKQGKQGRGKSLCPWGFKSMFNIHFSFKFLLCNHPQWVFFSPLSSSFIVFQWSNISLGKCHTALENMSFDTDF